MTYVAAVDLGATSGRVMIGQVGVNALRVWPVARFHNAPVESSEGLRWDIGGLYRNVLAGLAAAVRGEASISSIGIDSWAVDYALIRDGRMLAEPFHYRDERTAQGVDAVHALASPAELYAVNGLQFLPFNTLYQFATEKHLSAANCFLLIPDLLGYWLTGRHVAERTNASTTGLLSIQTGEWDDALIAKLGYPRSIFPELVNPGALLGALTPKIAAQVGGALNLTAVGSHDTASAVVAVPATSANFAFISCGTWGLVGVELEQPVLTEASRAANFTNEVGVDGRVRYLRNVMGLWLLSECVREWKLDLSELLTAATALTTPVSIFDPDDATFLAPGNMPQRIALWCVEVGLAPPQTPVEFVRSIVESLAVAFAKAVRDASALSGKAVEIVHIVGGGSQNELLCQLTANRCGMPVLAGPVEATAIGNVLVQSRTLGVANGSLESLRNLVATAFQPRRYLPLLAEDPLS